LNDQSLNALGLRAERYPRPQLSDQPTL